MKRASTVARCFERPPGELDSARTTVSAEAEEARYAEFVGRRKLVMLEFSGRDEARVCDTDRAQLSLFEFALIEVEADPIVLVFMIDEANEHADACVHPEPLHHLATEGLRIGFAIFDAASGELPEKRQDGAGTSLRNEVAPLALDEGGDDANLRLILPHTLRYITPMGEAQHGDEAKRIAYFGLPLGALALMRAGVTPVVIGIGHPNAPGMLRLRRARLPNTLLLARPDLEHPSVQRALFARRPDALLSFFWPKKIPAEILERMPLGAFGTHPSLLPRHRGPDPIFWTLVEGDKETGVSLHRLEPEYDTGAIVEVRSIPVDPKFHSMQLARALDRLALPMLIDAAKRLVRGERLEGTPQDDSLATLAPTPTNWDFSIDWKEPAARVLGRIRASAPYPGAIAQLGDHTIVILRAELGAGPHGFEPAEAFIDGERRVNVRAADAFVRIVSAVDLDERPIDPAALLRPSQQG